MRRPIVLGNWKMHGDSSTNEKLLRRFGSLWAGVHNTEVVVCPPYPYLPQAVQELSHCNVWVGAQDVSGFEDGAYTGDVSAVMLADIGCHLVILGHSERRRYYNESDELVAKKLSLVLEQSLVPVMCVGETLEERESGKALATIDRQLKPNLAQLSQHQLARSIIAYEPRWAIGTGKTATPKQAQEVHAHIREQLGEAAQRTRIIYGGSVKPDNAQELFRQPDIDGALVGGASLDVEKFLAICRSAE